jgi:hypothetical protein
METFEVGVESDHIERLAKAKPVNALSELIWNSYDADATTVRVDIEEGDVVQLGLIRISDNGNGIPRDQAQEYFESLGGSWKQKTRRTEQGRAIHGLKGQGRMKAFALGKSVVWYSDNNGQRFTISGSLSDIKTFQISDPVAAQSRGCVVEITEIEKDWEIRASHGFTAQIRDMFALQLYEDPNFSIIYDGEEIDAADAISAVTPVDIVTTTAEKVEYKAKLEIVEWRKSVDRKMMLCLPGRFSFFEMAPGIKARGFSFTAYLTSDYFQTLADENREGLIELDPIAQGLVSEAKDAMRVHFREREAHRSRAKIDEWQEAGVYPYRGTAEDPIERNERQVFDVVALNLADYSSEFENSPKKTQQLIFQLIKAAVETGPNTLPGLLAEVINLPPERQEEMAGLLQKTSLTGIIEAAKEVTNRLEFIKALQVLVFDPSSKRQLLERTQLHRIIAQETWVFGEEFNLVNDDEDLTSVLRSHLSVLGKDRSELAPDVDEKVLDADGKNAIVDLMLSQRVPTATDAKRKHLVIELKRPSQPINDDVINQTKKYARAVAADPRFKDTGTEWDFVAISNNITPDAEIESTQRDRPVGLVAEYDELKARVWVKTWGQVMQEAEGRLTFYRRKLGYQANEAQALEYLRTMNPDLLSDEVRRRVDELSTAESSKGSPER